MRKYAALPHEYLDEMAVLTDEEWGRLTRALLRYSVTGEEPALTGNERFFWRRVANREQSLQQHYEEVSAKRSQSGKKGMESRWGGITNDNKNNDVEDKDKVKVKDKDKDNSPPSTDGRRRGAAAARDERMRRDMAEIAKLVKGGGAR